MTEDGLSSTMLARHGVLLFGGSAGLVMDVLCCMARKYIKFPLYVAALVERASSAFY